jgi:hypothetical protein
MGTSRIFCDMDGVLVDFAEGAKSYLKIDPKTQASAFNNMWGSPQGWAKLMHDWPTFWMDLPELSQTQRLWRLIKPFHPSILTAIPEGWRSSGTGKYIWAKRHLPKFAGHPNEEFHAVLRSQKQQFAKQADGTPNLLIDDYVKNIREWTAAGGVGVLYTDDSTGLNNVKRALFALGFKAT